MGASLPLTLKGGVLYFPYYLAWINSGLDRLPFLGYLFSAPILWAEDGKARKKGRRFRGY
ncbi:MAG TPA: hypothetical protein VKA34_15470 [Balneolales bacterium]|nr:hypothetical protein [Balneolales bacterium]